MGIMKEAIDKEDWQRMQKGLKPKPKPPKVMPTYKAPIVDNHIRLKDIPLQSVIGFSSSPKTVRNAEEVRFIGYDVIINVKDKPKPISGWMSENDVIRLRQLTGGAAR